MSYLQCIKGIKFKVNYLLLVVMGIYLYYGYGLEILIALMSIFLHELSHVIASAMLGMEMKEIEIFPLGGIAKSDGLFWFSVSEEIIVAVVGPAMNIILALFFYTISTTIQDNNIIQLITKVNLVIGIVNLLPIFPLDGGKIIRAIISDKIGFKQCTKKMTSITYIIASLTIILGIIQIVLSGKGLYLVILSIFLLLAARRESKMAAFLFIHEMLGKQRDIVKRRIMKTHLLVGIKSLTVKEITDYFIPKRYHIIIVIDFSGRTLGTLHEKDLLEGTLEYGTDVTLEKLLIVKEK